MSDLRKRKAINKLGEDLSSDQRQKNSTKPVKGKVISKLDERDTDQCDADIDLQKNNEPMKSADSHCNKISPKNKVAISNPGSEEMKLEKDANDLSSHSIGAGGSDRFQQIQEIILKGKKLQIPESELCNLFYFTPVYFKLLRYTPFFGFDLRRKHLGLDGIISPLHFYMSLSLNKIWEFLLRSIQLKIFASKIFWTSVIYFTVFTYLFFHHIYNSKKSRAEFFEESCGEIFRPPMACEVCRQLKAVPEVTNLSREDFRHKYAFTGVPVVIRGAVPAIKGVSFNHFKNEYRKNPQALEDIDEECQFFGYSTTFETLSEVFKMNSKRAKLMKGQKPWYIGWSSCTDASRAVTSKIYTKPDFLPQLDAEKKTDWVFMGGAGHGAPIHIDYVSYPSWQAQLTGRKTWRFIPSYECESVCQTLEVTVNTGDVITLDTNMWFHTTQILPGSISVTIGSEYS